MISFKVVILLFIIFYTQADPNAQDYETAISQKHKEMILDGTHNIGTLVKFVNGVGEIICPDDRIEACYYPGQVSVNILPYMAASTISVGNQNTLCLASILTHIYGAHGGTHKLSVILIDDNGNANPLPVVLLGVRIKIVKVSISLDQICVVYYEHKKDECGACEPTQLVVREFKVNSSSDNTVTLVDVEK